MTERVTSTVAERKRQHIEKMLQRALRKERQASRLVLKWRAVLAGFDREDPARHQHLLWENVIETASEN